MEYRAVIFDCDGTLADTLPWMRTVYNRLADEHGLRRVEAEDTERFRDLHGRELLAALNLPLWKVPRLVRAMRRRMAAHRGEFTLFPGISEVLRGLRGAGFALGVVSSNSRENVEYVLGPDNARLIQVYGCGASLFGKAPKLRGALRACGAGTGSGIYVGDEARDAEAARQAGCAFGAVAWGQQSAARLRRENPALVFESPGDILRLLSMNGANPECESE